MKSVYFFFIQIFIPVFIVIVDAILSAAGAGSSDGATVSATFSPFVLRRDVEVDLSTYHITSSGPVGLNDSACLQIIFTASTILALQPYQAVVACPPLS
ncbi:unnamed protein product, partial [Protopolystoma xenopodis]